ncbi:MAG: hypothetical protein K6347_04725 [Campylobacterales bacterium]
MKLLLLAENATVRRLVELSAGKVGIEVLEFAPDSLPDTSVDFLAIEMELVTDALQEEIATHYPQAQKILIMPRDAQKMAGFDHFIKKPFLPTELVDLFNAHMPKSDVDWVERSTFAQPSLVDKNEEPSDKIDLDALALTSLSKEPASDRAEDLDDLLESHTQDVDQSVSEEHLGEGLGELEEIGLIDEGENEATLDQVGGQSDLSWDELGEESQLADSSDFGDTEALSEPSANEETVSLDADSKTEQKLEEAWDETLSTDIDDIFASESEVNTESVAGDREALEQMQHVGFDLSNEEFGERSLESAAVCEESGFDLLGDHIQSEEEVSQLNDWDGVELTTDLSGELAHDEMAQPVTMSENEVSTTILDVSDLNEIKKLLDDDEPFELEPIDKESEHESGEERMLESQEDEFAQLSESELAEALGEVLEQKSEIVEKEVQDENIVHPEDDLVSNERSDDIVTTCAALPDETAASVQRQVAEQLSTLLAGIPVEKLREVLNGMQVTITLSFPEKRS